MSKKHLAIVILAAGKGTRMKSETPKVMHELAGLPMINWVLKTAAQLKPQKIVVVTGPDMPELVEAVKPYKTALQPKRNGTGGAVKAALPLLKGFRGDVLILLGDTPLVTVETLQGLIAAKGKAGISVLGCTLKNPEGYGRLVTDKSGALKKIVEDKDASAKEKAINLVNTGAFCVDGAKLAEWVGAIGNKNAQKEYYLTDLPEIAARKKVKTHIHVICDETEVMGCNTLSDLAALEKTLQGRLRDEAMKQGARLIDPATVYFHHDTKIGRGVTVEPNVYFGPGVEIADDVTIKAFCHFEGVKIASGGSIGPFARLRPGTQIGKDVRIGNFVEVKKSRIGKGSKINHLAYVGDTDMGEDTNFSAGAITVNYDGYDKHQTVIGKGVMVGSNVNLVAPVTVGDGAFIAAGSTITDDVPADALSIERTEAKTRKGWAASYRKRKRSRK
ncbi:MAG TPA: bifunctional UDP-N-acetylglucosamine diphosphorylase/glucosamine-1-phosphate N-acetyltransferase GlmU [Rhodospirillaceae bacterium]|nr:bifunctional UDP-N-acetylglucosamine diphosphorylase/glucosamine-1-phosphate N-acetyltransferase GlmU [Rhodospirillaceae bacterium]